MASTIQDLETRLAALEREVSGLRQLVESRLIEATAAERGAWMLREAKARQAGLSAAVARAFEAMGITGEPIGAENVQKMIAAEGIIDPNANEFSRAINEMREE